MKAIQTVSASNPSTPDQPVVVIEPARSWVPLDLRDIWNHRELLYFLMLRDVKVRYKQTTLGATWAVLQPLLSMVIFTYFFGMLAKIPTDGVPYPIFVYTGLLPWIYFSNSITNSGNSLVANPTLITKVYFPRMMIPAASVGAGLIDFAIASVLLVGLMIYYSFPLTWGMLMLVPLVALTTLCALGIGMWMAALNVKYRDVRYALPFLIQIWMFLTPVIYPATLVPEKWRWLLSFNPLTGLIGGFRSALLGRPFEWGALGAATAFTLLLLVYASYFFKRMERSFAELV